MKLEPKITIEGDDAKSPQKSIPECIKAKDLTKLTKLLQEINIADINQPDWDGTGNPPILDATLQGEVEMVR